MKLSDQCKMNGHMELIVTDSKTGEIKRILRSKNKIMASVGYGVGIIMQHLGGDDSNSLNINQAKIGTGTTAPSASDTDLETPTTLNSSGAYVARGSANVSATSVVYEFFLSDADLPNGTYNEFGLFTEDGRIFTRLLISQPSGFTKASNEDATVRYTVNITPN